jgi:hypothetical protein
MNTHKKPRWDTGSSRKRTKGTPLWAQDYQKDAEEEQLEDLVFGAALKQDLQNHNSDQEDLTGLEHIPDSQVSFSLCVLCYVTDAFPCQALLF